MSDTEKNESTPLCNNFIFTGHFDNILLNFLYDTSLKLTCLVWFTLTNAPAQLLKTSDLTDSIIKRSLLFIAYGITGLTLGILLYIIAFPIWITTTFFRCRSFRTVSNNFKLNKNLKTRFKNNNKNITVLSANLCLLNEIAARVNNLSNVKQRSKLVAKRTISYHEKFKQKLSNSTFIQTNIPNTVDFICFQEVFERSAAENIIKTIKNDFPFIIYDIGTLVGSELGFDRKYFVMENSGLFIASKYPVEFIKFKTYNNATYGDKWSGKGCLIVIIKIMEDNFAVLINTHMQAQEGSKPSKIRSEHVKFLHSQMIISVNEFVDKNNLNINQIKFSLICGDFNFDLKLHKFESKNFHEDSSTFKNFNDAHEGTEVATLLHQAKINEMKSAKMFSDEILKSRLVNALDHYELDHEDYYHITYEDDLMSVDKRSQLPVKLDHIWYDPSICQKVEATYYSTFYGLTDHVAIGAKFMMK